MMPYSKIFPTTADVNKTKEKNIKKSIKKSIKKKH